jgi:hypothetical protein
VGSLDLPDQPDEARQAKHAGERGADRSTPKSREMPDPDERGRAYEAAMAHVSAETGKCAEQDRRPDGAERGTYWSEVPRFREMWADHERRWPGRQHAAEPDRWSDPPGTYRSKGGLKLDPEQHAEANEAIHRIRETVRPISADMQTIGKENTYGGWLEGFDHRIKGDDRLKEKIAAVLKVEPRLPAAEALREVPDAIRYTYCLQADNYTRGYYDVKERFESRGYEMYYSENHWTNPEYKGINTRWVTPMGQRFEVQFHTTESFHAKHDVTHVAYERIRDTSTSRTEKRELHEFQRQVCTPIEIPEGATDIPNYRKEGF